MKRISVTLARFIERMPWLFIAVAIVVSIALAPGVTLLESETGFSALVSSGEHGPGGYHEARHVEPGEGHKHPRGYLVAVGKKYQAVEAVGVCDALHHVRYQLSGRKGVVHP